MVMLTPGAVAEHHRTVLRYADNAYNGFPRGDRLFDYDQKIVVHTKRSGRSTAQYDFYFPFTTAGASSRVIDAIATELGDAAVSVVWPSLLGSVPDREVVVTMARAPEPSEGSLPLSITVSERTITARPRLDVRPARWTAGTEWAAGDIARVPAELQAMLQTALTIALHVAVTPDMLRNTAGHAGRTGSPAAPTSGTAIGT